MELTDLKVKRIIYPHWELRLGEPADVIDEGGFYRIAGTHIIDKFKIENIEENDGKVEITIRDGKAVLGV